MLPIKPNLADQSWHGLFSTSTAQCFDQCSQFLVERQLISRELAAVLDGPRGVAFDSKESISVMVNEEDHLRLGAPEWVRPRRRVGRHR